eukprot:TRINITY_DN1637_c0_g1_i3.p1 TRINITY_DN1637_c0_g1~~TRINITY_DN1637_c0_g1_i3.p1  ORF type:complete len:106 (-),score=12.67 TRINITY_DN1637_c0_g1_i3:138-455(-)
MSKGDVKKGAKLFKQKCEQCHSVIAADGNKQGPNLHGVVGRKAGTVAGFDYTAANKSSGITWTEAELLDYLKDPKKKIPGTKMVFAGFAREPDRKDMFAFLKSNS